ncbi:transcription factor/nuclear export subunit protein 2-domain-containing protein [Epithele typhae]|uniref:transcription factor/nuclear export subunit protein 2-domain-containing protein n=1 Tax=Epithele typhae TaxID=378194 RepID=UPI0020084ED5|nr:transcription factor/nuclear export subunit protein 2-domain-containing protein [Epithele typhae]KAH9943361.1 transcription factor/nuclear export subunit protein 2-domain-containing protein [Epithele typhae]
MDVLETAQQCLEKWENGGDVECRNLLSASHSNPYDPDCNAVLTTVYQALLSSTLTSFSAKKTISVDSVISFIRSVLEHLPSSSTGKDKNPSIAAIGDVLVDIIWSIDGELEEILLDAKNMATAADQDTLSPTTVAQAVTSKENAESDKATLVSLLRRFLVIGVVDPNICRERLDINLVATAGLILDKLSFERKEIRMRTALFYKQNKFNLLREQSEGYSKLTAELTGSLGPAHNPSTGYPVETAAGIEGRARPAWERALSLIGYFDLDPNRALDIILDVFSVHLATHHSFFLALLSFSPWGGQTRQGVKQEEMAVEPDVTQYRGKTLDEIISIAEQQAAAPIIATNSSNARVLAQVLGFKFTYYQSPDVLETTPRNLYLMAAVLIREGFLTLEDLYLHIGPLDENMVELHKAYLANVDARIAGAKISQLAMAAPLESGGSSSGKPKPAPEPKKEEKVEETPNQKLGLVHALLSVGVLRPAISILSKFPWMVDAYPELADLMLRVVHHSFGPLYETAVELVSPSAANKTKLASFATPRARYGSAGVVPVPERKPQLSLVAPTPPVTSTTEFVFFYPDWTSRVPMCSSYDDLMDVVEPLMRFIGLHISRDPTFLTKFARIGRQHISTVCEVDPATKKQIGLPNPEHPVMRFWLKVIRLYFLPSLPLIRGNAVCTVDVWSIVRQYETTTRWQLYGEWKSSVYKSHPELRIRQVQADREAKGIMRRLSHNTVGTLAGAVAKLANSNPCIFFTNAVNQVMAYDNLAGVVLLSLNFVTIMGFDVLVYVILDALSNPHKERVKDDGVNTSDWLLSLASFTGMLYRRYSADLTPILSYIVHQLNNRQTTEIIVFRELIWKMASIEPLPSLSDSQVAAMAGGPTLRIEAVASAARGARQDINDTVGKAHARFGFSLINSKLALPLLIQVAQQRQSCVFQAPDAHLKSLASLFDMTHGVLLQYLELLTTPTVIPAEDYANKIVPPLAELHEKYGICAAICMQIYRPILNNTLLAAALQFEEQERIASEEAEKRLKAALTAKQGAANADTANEGKASSESKPPAEAKPTVSESPSGDVVMEVADPKPPSAPESPWLPELIPLLDDVKKLIPPTVCDVIGAPFYLTFWQLSTYDLTPPTTRYDEEYGSLKALLHQEDSLANSAARSPDRAKRMTAGLHREKHRRIDIIMSTLRRELKQQTASRKFTLKRLAREKQHWFAHNPPRPTLASYMIEHCILPRCLLSPMDADFCAQFIKVMHLQGTPGFSTVMCYDKILSDNVKVVLFSCSEYEARNYGRFLLGILGDLYKWFQNKELFRQENHFKTGGNTTPLPGFQNRNTLMGWNDFQQILRKWHKRVAKCLEDSIKSGEFMHVYNTIILLKEILPVFPVAAIHDISGLWVSSAIEKLLENETRGDLKILARAYHASLKKRESIWAPPVRPKPKPPAPAVQPDRSRVGTPTASGAAVPPAADTRRPAPPSVAPSAPKSHANSASTTSPAPIERNGTPNNTKSAMESVPRPEVVKRVRPEARPTENGKPAVEVKNDVMDIDQPSTRDMPSKVASPIPTSLSQELRSSRPPTPNQASAARSNPSKPMPGSPRVPHGIPPRPDLQQHMPPPSEPSQTASAQELRETAKHSRTTNGDKSDVHPPTEPRSQAAAAPSPARRRSPSPPSRPGTRNPSTESRASGDRRLTRDKPDEKRPERDPARRGDRRAAREERDKDGDRDRDARRDRHGDRERRDRDRDRERERERDKERERERGDRHGHRERDGERSDRERDRHRREDRSDKERERESRKEREAAGRGSRPDTGRHRADDTLGKRRRGGDDEPDRPSKRSSRKESHHEDRSRRSSEKDGHDRSGRDGDRRRKDRDGDGDGKGLSIDTKLGEKRIPDGPASAKTLPPSTPSAPRAMAGDARKPPTGATATATGSATAGSAGSPRTSSLDGPDGGGGGGGRKADDERGSDGGRKRTLADRDGDGGGGGGAGEPAAQAPKRPKIIRDRYLAKALPSMDGEKARARRD